MRRPQIILQFLVDLGASIYHLFRTGWSVPQLLHRLGDVGGGTSNREVVRAQIFLLVCVEAPSHLCGVALVIIDDVAHSRVQRIRLQVLAPIIEIGFFDIVAQSVLLLLLSVSELVSRELRICHRQPLVVVSIPKNNARGSCTLAGGLFTSGPQCGFVAYF